MVMVRHAGREDILFFICDRLRAVYMARRNRTLFASQRGMTIKELDQLPVERMQYK